MWQQTKLMHGNGILKPLAIVDYINKMGGYDTSDQLISSKSFLVEETVYASSKYASSECTYTKFQVWL